MTMKITLRGSVYLESVNLCGKLVCGYMFIKMPARMLHYSVFLPQNIMNLSTKRREGFGFLWVKSQTHHWFD